MIEESSETILQYCLIKNKEPQKDSIIQIAAEHAAASIFDTVNKRLSDCSRTPKKSFFIYTNILTPEIAPRWFLDRSMLWNELERAAGDLVEQIIIAQEIKLSYPQGLSSSDMIKAAENIVINYINNQGLIADTFVHLSKPHDPHMHMLIPLIAYNNQGFIPQSIDSFNELQLSELQKIWQTQVF